MAGRSLRVELRRLEPRPYACVPAVTVPREVGATLHRLLPEVTAFLHAHGLRAVGAPLARYYRYEPDVVEMDAGVVISGQVEGQETVAMEDLPGGEVQIKELPGGEVAVGTHLGPYRTLKGTYDALTEFIAAQGRTAGEAPWEVYVTDSAAEPDSARWITEVYWPVRAAGSAL